MQGVLNSHTLQSEIHKRLFGGLLLVLFLQAALTDDFTLDTPLNFLSCYALCFLRFSRREERNMLCFLNSSLLCFLKFSPTDILTCVV